jgi:hypothetical protein
MGKLVRLDIIDIDQYKRMTGVIWIGSPADKRKEVKGKTI